MFCDFVYFIRKRKVCYSSLDVEKCVMCKFQERHIVNICAHSNCSRVVNNFDRGHPRRGTQYKYRNSTVYRHTVYITVERVHWQLSSTGHTKKPVSCLYSIHLNNPHYYFLPSTQHTNNIFYRRKHQDSLIHVNMQCVTVTEKK